MAEQFLQIYLDESNYSREDDEESRLELCLLLIHCYEVRNFFFIWHYIQHGNSYCLSYHIGHHHYENIMRVLYSKFSRPLYL